MKYINSDTAGVSLQRRAFRFFYKETPTSFYHRHLRRMWYLFIILSSIFFVSAAYADEISAENLLKSTNLPNGIICVPDCGDGDLALELAQKSKFMVFVMDQDENNVAAAKDKAMKAGLLGRRLYVQQGTKDKIPLAENYVDLLVLNNLKNEDLTEKLAAEINRVLTPVLGTVLFTGDTGKKEIEQFLKKDVFSGYLLLDTGYLASRKPSLQGSDDWSHKLHGPNNNPVSEDTVFQLPPIQHNRAMPMFNPAHGATVVQGGISLEIMDWEQSNEWVMRLCGRMYARNIYNGRILWEVDNFYGNTTSLPTLAAVDGVVYYVTNQKAAVIRRELATGKELDPIDLDGADKRVKWLAVAHGKLFALIGGRHTNDRPYTWFVPYPRENLEKDLLYGDHIVAYDLKAGTVLWKHSETIPIDYRNIAVNSDRLYYYCKETKLACLSVGDGKEIWSHEEPELFEKIPALTRDKKGRLMTGKYDQFNASSLIVADDLILIGSWGDHKGNLNPVLILNSKDGTFLSKIGPDKWTWIHRTFIINNKVYVNNKGYDPQTGNVLPDSEKLPAPLGLGGCGTGTYAPGIGVMGHVVLGYKSPCAVGSWVAGGLQLNLPTICSCMSLRGSAAFAAGEKIFERAETQAEHPLVEGEAFNRVQGSGFGGQEGDWGTHRGNNGRTGASSVSVPEAVKVRWTAKPEHPFLYSTVYNRNGMSFDERPVPPISAAGMTFTAGSEGVITARSLKDGKELWSFSADGSILTPPAYAGGRLFVPGGDGWIYALDAATGKLAWKRRLAPLPRRILLFNQLMSNWPVLSLAVENDVVYASAGMARTDGGKSFALNADTGEIIWEHLHSGRQGFAGHTAIIRERIWSPGYTTLPLCLNSADGSQGAGDLAKKLSTPDADHLARGYYTNSGGQDVIQVGEEHVLVGGTFLLEEQQMRNAKRNIRSYMLYHVNQKGAWDLEEHSPVNNVLRNARVSPASDGKLIAFVSPPPYKVDSKTGKLTKEPSGVLDLSTEGLNVWSVKGFLASAHGMVKEQIVFPRGDRLLIDPRKRGTEDLFPYEKAAWQKPDLDVNAVVLSGNAVIAAHAQGRKAITHGWKKRTDQEKIEMKRSAPFSYTGWKLSAFAREDGKELWSVDLPSEPLYNGLAIAADGSILVTLRDGSVVCVK